MITRRRLLQTFCALPVFSGWPGIALAQTTVDIPRLKAGYAQRLKKILAAGELPYIDIESSCNATRVDIKAIADSMDRLNIGLMALSSDIGKGQFDKGVHHDRFSDRLLASHPGYFIPIGNGGQAPALTDATTEFLDAQEAAAQNRDILLLGEYEFRHYPSPRQAKRGDDDRDVQIPIDGAIGHRVFAISEKTGASFQIHYEIEDELLGPLEKMLEQYPKAKVVWCHVAQIRYIERASRYSPSYVDGLIRRFPNLHFDTAFGNAASVYPLSNQRHSRVWDIGGGLKSEWHDLIAAHSQRFLSALDIGGDRMNRIPEYDTNHRYFLKQLPTGVQHQLAYRNTWRLLFGEEFA